MNWFKKRMLNISLALYNVEKNALGQGGQTLTDNISKEQKLNQGTLADDLINGEVTQEVVALRARMYKVMEEAENWTYKGNQTTDERGVRVNKEIISNKIKGEPTDELKVDLVLLNTPVTQSIKDAMSSINGGEMVDGKLKNLRFKEEFPLIIGRENIPKFYIENFTKELYVKSINEKEKLLEFFISQYVDEYDDRTTYLIKELEKLIEKPIYSSLLDFTDVGFITQNNNTIGKKNNRQFEYKITSFDKIVKFKGNYVIKFKANVEVDGLNIAEKYESEELNEKYKNKEPKKRKH